MDKPDYFVINPLQLEILLAINSNNNSKYSPISENNMSIIDKRFYEKMEKLKNISLQTRRLKYMITHRRSLYDISG